MEALAMYALAFIVKAHELDIEKSLHLTQECINFVIRQIARKTVEFYIIMVLLVPLRLEIFLLVHGKRQRRSYLLAVY